MMIEQEMVIIKAADLEAYKAKHYPQDDELPVVKFFSAKVPDNAYYEDRIKSLLTENESLKKDVERLTKWLDIAEKKINSLNAKIEKLKEAFVDASIR